MPPSGSTQPFPAAYAHMSEKPSSHASVGGRPRQRAQGHRVHHEVLPVGPQASQPGLVHDPSQVALALDRHGEAGEVVVLAEVDPRLGEVDHDDHALRRYSCRFVP